MALKTNYRDDVFEGNRKYTLTQGGDGKYEIIDSTNYTVQGDTFGANDMNATNATVNSLVNSKLYTVRGENWSNTAPYTQRVEASGMKATDIPIISVIIAEWQRDPVDIKNSKKAFSYVDLIETFDGYMVLTAFNKKPEWGFNILVKGV